MTATDTRSFLDTNVLLYAYDAHAGDRHDRASELVGSLGAARQAAVSVQVLQEFYVNVTRKIAEPLPVNAAVDRIRAFSRWPVHAPAGGDVIAAAELSEDAQLSFWDAMIVHSAAQLGCPVLWSEDLNPGQRILGVEIRNPFATG
ncbi:MAG: PIN domain-containing protein [Egibacteraceae bacterium]